MINQSNFFIQGSRFLRRDFFVYPLRPWYTLRNTDSRMGTFLRKRVTSPFSKLENSLFIWMKNVGFIARNHDLDFCRLTWLVIRMDAFKVGSSSLAYSQFEINKQYNSANASLYSVKLRYLIEFFISSSLCLLLFYLWFYFCVPQSNAIVFFTSLPPRYY